jgi:hypothetical protein
MPKRLRNSSRGKSFYIESDSIGDYIKHINGVKEYFLTTAITANVTATTAAAGSWGRTSHATGNGKIFVSDGSKWQAS